MKNAKQALTEIKEMLETKSATLKAIKEIAKSEGFDIQT